MNSWVPVLLQIFAMHLHCALGGQNSFDRHVGRGSDHPQGVQILMAPRGRNMGFTVRHWANHISYRYDKRDKHNQLITEPHSCFAKKGNVGKIGQPNLYPRKASSLRKGELVDRVEGFKRGRIRISVRHGRASSRTRAKDPPRRAPCRTNTCNYRSRSSGSMRA